MAGIKRYNHITALPGSLYAYKWTLRDFLARGLHRFVEDVPDSNYVKRGGENRYSPDQIDEMVRKAAEETKHITLKAKK